METSSKCFLLWTLRAHITFLTAGSSLFLHACLPSISPCVSEGEAVSNWSSLQAHSTTPGGITQRSARSGCDTGSSNNRAQGSQWVMSPPSRASAHAQGTRKCVYLPCLVWQPPHPRPTRLARNRNSYLLLCLWSPTIPPTKHIMWFSMESYVRFIGLFPGASHRSAVDALMYT